MPSPSLDASWASRCSWGGDATEVAAGRKGAAARVWPTRSPAWGRHERDDPLFSESVLLLTSSQQAYTATQTLHPKTYQFVPRFI
jgi:hypothetical protein